MWRWSPAIDQTAIAIIWLYWSPEKPDKITERKVMRYLDRYLKNLMDVDDNLRQIIFGLLPGTGWYFYRDFLK